MREFRASAASTIPSTRCADTGERQLYVTELGGQRGSPCCGRSAASEDQPRSTRLIFNDVQGGAPERHPDPHVTNPAAAALTITGRVDQRWTAIQFQLVTHRPLPRPVVPRAIGDDRGRLQSDHGRSDGRSTRYRERRCCNSCRALTFRVSAPWAERNQRAVSAVDPRHLPDPGQTGDPNPADSLLPASPFWGRGLRADRLQKAGDSAGHDRAAGRLGPQSTAGTVASRRLVCLGDTAAQDTTVLGSELRLPVSATGDLRISVVRSGTATFSCYSTWPFFRIATSFQEDVFNTWEPTRRTHKVRLYPARASDGSPSSPNAYVVAFEETTSAYDYQDSSSSSVTSSRVRRPPPSSSQPVNFQPATAPVPDGVRRGFGRRLQRCPGYGWVRQRACRRHPLTLDLSPNTRDRNLEADQALDTFIHMQYPAVGSSPTAVKTPGAWEYALPNGTYQVTVAVGDPLVGRDPENYVIHVEGVTAIAGYVPSGNNGSPTRHRRPP